MLLACKPNDEKAYVRYVDQVACHYGNRVAAYQVFNELLYTFYALPASLGHTVEDYIHLLQMTYQTIKAT